MGIEKTETNNEQGGIAGKEEIRRVIVAFCNKFNEAKLPIARKVAFNSAPEEIKLDSDAIMSALEHCTIGETHLKEIESKIDALELDRDVSSIVAQRYITELFQDLSPAKIWKKITYFIEANVKKADEITEKQLDDINVQLNQLVLKYGKEKTKEDLALFIRSYSLLTELSSKIGDHNTEAKSKIVKKFDDALKSIKELCPNLISVFYYMQLDDRITPHRKNNGNGLNNDNTKLEENNNSAGSKIQNKSNNEENSEEVQEKTEKRLDDINVQLNTLVLKYGKEKTKEWKKDLALFKRLHTLLMELSSKLVIGDHNTEAKSKIVKKFDDALKSIDELCPKLISAVYYMELNDRITPRNPNSNPNSDSYTNSNLGSDLKTNPDCQQVYGKLAAIRELLRPYQDEGKKYEVSLGGAIIEVGSDRDKIKMRVPDGIKRIYNICNNNRITDNAKVDEISKLMDMKLKAGFFSTATLFRSQDTKDLYKKIEQVCNEQPAPKLEPL
ncbi:MAG: hypothetical protein ACO2ZM_00115 [Francisellaceae bacterium]